MGAAGLRAEPETRQESGFALGRTRRPSLWPEGLHIVLAPYLFCARAHTHTHTHSSVFSGWGLLPMDPLTLATVSSCSQLCWTRVYLLAEVASGLETISSGCLKELVYLARRQRGIWG